jgi:hypothetical protein
MRNAIAAAIFLVSMAVPLAASPAPEARHRIDAARERLWVLNRDGVFVVDLAKATRTAIALPHWLRVGGEHACLPDLALGPKGDVVVTSNIVPTLWRIDADSLAVSVHRPLLDAATDRDIGFSGLVYSEQHGAWFAASHHHGSLWRIDATLRTASKVPLSEAIAETCL